MVSIAGWVMPAPAPCANTKQARASRGRIRSAETAPDVPTSILSFCATTSFIAQTSRGRAESSTRETGGYALSDLKANGDPGMTRTCDLRFRNAPARMVTSAVVYDSVGVFGPYSPSSVYLVMGSTNCLGPNLGPMKKSRRRTDGLGR